MFHLVTKIIEHILLATTIAWLMNIIRTATFLEKTRNTITDTTKKSRIKPKIAYALYCTTCLPLYIFAPIYPLYILYPETTLRIVLVVFTLFMGTKIFEKWYMNGI